MNSSADPADLLRAMDLASCGITLADCRQPDMPLIYINEAFTRITGYSVDETLGRNCRFLQADDRDQPAIEELRNAIREERACQVIFRNYRKDGELFHNELIMSPIHKDGVLTHFVGIQSDVSDRVAIMKELTDKNRELEDFAFIVSHDLRAPLRQIGVLADMLREDEGDRLTEQGQELLGLMAGRVERLGNLIKGILEYSRVGRRHEERVAVDIRELVDEVIEMLAPPENLSLNMKGDFPQLVCEQEPVARVFQNLIGNAIKYMDKKDGVIDIHCEEEPEFWRFTIRDNGPGIEPQYHERIFQLFQALQSRDHIESSGIGLATVKKYVETEGGTIEVDSDLGKGSAFSFTLPKDPVNG